MDKLVNLDAHPPSVDSRDRNRQFTEEARFLFWILICVWLFVYGPTFSFRNISAALVSGFTIVMGCSVLSGAKLGLQLGLPGAPFIAEKRFQAPARITLREILSSGMSWGIALVLVSLVESISQVALIHFLRNGFATVRGAAPHAPAHVLPPAQAVVLAFAAKILASIGAGITEEMIFRMSLMAFILFAVTKYAGASTESPSSRAVWMATVVQAYLFSLFHLVQLVKTATSLHIPWPLAALVMPQFTVGILLERLYLKKGLEACTLAHVTIDVVVSVFSLIWLLTGHSERLLFGG